MIAQRPTLAAGARLGPYEVEALVGSGGMADVYRGHDTRLKRVVAIKVLGAEAADTPERRQRLEREARAVSLLSHPNICVLYDVGEDRGSPYLVMEFVAGETLAQRLRRGALPIAEALRLAMLIADALDHAHRQGVVHRDLKPSNIILGPAGPKLVDFGLAKLRERESDDPRPTDDTESITDDGLLLGTLPYMAPEQVEAKQADSRSDIFAFGAVLYEMITARRAFDAESKAGLIVSILQHDPPPIATSQAVQAWPETPLGVSLVEHVVTRCLAKQPDDRWQTAADLKRELRWILERSWHRERDGAPEPRVRRAWWIAAGLSVAAVLGVSAWMALRPATPVADSPIATAAFPLPLAPGLTFIEGPAAPLAAVSPDGAWIAYTAGTSNVASALWLWRVRDGVVRPLPHTEGAEHPFWSPDSRSIGYFAEGRVMTTRLDDKAPVVLASAPAPDGGAWGADDQILFAPAQDGGLLRISAAGGAVTAATRLDEADHERRHSWPAFLPDGRHFVYFVQNSDPARTGIVLASIDAPVDQRVFLIATDARAAYARGSLIFGREGTLFARPFDWKRQTFTGEATPIVTDVVYNPGNGRMAFAISDTALVYRAGSKGGATASRLEWRDRTGRAVGAVGDPVSHLGIAGSPDGRYVVVTQGDPVELRLFNLGLGSRQVSGSPAVMSNTVWARDSTAFVYQLATGAIVRLDVRTGQEATILRGLPRSFLSGWSPDGHAVLFNASDSVTGADILEGTVSDGHRRAFLATPGTEGHGQFSPDGRWITYVSNETGRKEVWVRAYAGGTKFRISEGGGYDPQWRADARALYYLDARSRLVEVDVRLDPTFAQGGSRVLFQAWVNEGLAQHFVSQYAVSRDGQRFLVKTPVDPEPPLIAVLNWTRVASH